MCTICGPPPCYLIFRMGISLLFWIGIKYKRNKNHYLLHGWKPLLWDFTPLYPIKVDITQKNNEWELKSLNIRQRCHAERGCFAAVCGRSPAGWSRLDAGGLAAFHPWVRFWADIAAWENVNRPCGFLPGRQWFGLNKEGRPSETFRRPAYRFGN